MRTRIKTIEDLQRVSLLFPKGHIKQLGKITFWVFSFFNNHSKVKFHNR